MCLSFFTLKITLNSNQQKNDSGDTLFDLKTLASHRESTQPIIINSLTFHIFVL
jgi:hypothetical protein